MRTFDVQGIEIRAARAAVFGFVSDPRRVAAAVRLGRVQPAALEFAENAVSFDEVRSAVRLAGHARAALEIHRTSHPRKSSVQIAQRIIASFDTMTRA
jgi:hypothetical protein